MLDIAQDVGERLMRYVQIDTQSDERAQSVPSTAKQFDLLQLLRDELTALGAHDVRLTEQGFVFATLPATVERAGVPRIAFLAHVDTAPAFSGTGVKPILHQKYDGQPIVLPDDQTQVLSPDHYPYLEQKIGDDIITASGTTLLGADDKAGVAILMTLAAHLLASPDILHGEVQLCFTPDEEIGAGIRYLDLAELGADYAYTLDGGQLGELTYETFSADKAVVTIDGVSVHPGTAFGILVNALHLAATLIATLPQHTRTPETTQGRAGFVHVYQVEGNAAHAEVALILRDFEPAGLQSHGDMVQAVCNALAATEPRAKISCTITPQYRNMRYWLEKDMRPVDIAREAMEAQGIAPISTPIRGGTDGSQLTERGVLTPNIFAGMQNIHGPLEWVSVQDMAKAVEVCATIARLWAGK